MNWEERESQELQLDEGVQPVAYKDQFGNWTIGIGHLLGKGDQYKGLVWTEEQITNQFIADWQTAVEGAEWAVPCFQGLDGPRKGALCNMAFQMGGRTLGTFHSFINFLDDLKYDEAALDLMNTAYARQVSARAKRIAYRIRTGAYAPR